MALVQLLMCCVGAIQNAPHGRRVYLRQQIICLYVLRDNKGSGAWRQVWEPRGEDHNSSDGEQAGVWQQRLVPSNMLCEIVPTC